MPRPLSLRFGATRAWGAARLQALMQASNRLHLPAPAVLPVAGAIVGLYSGLLAGVFSNLIGLISSLVLGAAGPKSLLAPSFGSELRALMSAKNWHLDFALVAGLPALAALALARAIDPGGPRDIVKRRLKVMALLVLGALALYYPLVGLTLLNRALGGGRILPENVSQMPWWALLLVPSLGGVLVGRLLRDHPATHGHGIPEVVRAVRQEREGLRVREGVLKIAASAVTIATGGSAGREGPIVFGGAAIAAGAARTLGFSRRDLAILMASGAGGAIAASFNAPMAGAIFAAEIILREFELKVFSPIILASVTATLIGRGLMGAAPMLRRWPYEMVSSWEVVSYVALGLICGLLAFAFVWMLHRTEDFFMGRRPHRLSRFLGAQPSWRRAAIGGLVVGALALLSPAVWGTGHHFSNLAASHKLSLGFLLVACALKLVATSVTIGSGNSGGTFFPATVIGAMAGGAFGEVIHRLAPALTAPSGAYALVGMGGVVAGLTRGPLTGMVMIYELTGNYRIVLPLMMVCTIASALCHFLLERRRLYPGQDALRETRVGQLMVELQAVPAHCPLREVVDRVVASGEIALPALDGRGELCGVIQLHELRPVWQDKPLVSTLLAQDVTHRMPCLDAGDNLRRALRIMDAEDMDVCPVLRPPADPPMAGLITRAAIRRHLAASGAQEHARGAHPVASTEIPR